MDGAGVRGKLERIRKGGAPAAHEKLAAEKKLFARARIARLFDADSFVEDAVFANAQAADLPADGVVTGVGRIDGRSVCVMANDSTVKAGSWGKRTVEKIIRIQETAERLRVPLVYLVDSAGARITDQVEMFPGRRGAGRIFYNQVRLSGLDARRCAACSGRRPRAARTSPRSATSCSWSRAPPACTSARRGWPRW